MNVIVIPRAFGGAVILPIVPLSTPTKVQALAITGGVIARGQSGMVVVQSRDGNALSEGTSGIAVALGRDNSVVGKGR